MGKASYNRKISKKKGRAVEDPLKMPPIVQFSSEKIREKEWDNIVAIHEGLAMATTWSYDKVKMGDLKLLPERFQKKNMDCNIEVVATCLTISHCGNFVVIGYSTGHVDRWAYLFHPKLFSLVSIYIKIFPFKLLFLPKFMFWFLILFYNKWFLWARNRKYIRNWFCSGTVKTW